MPKANAHRSLEKVGVRKVCQGYISGWLDGEQLNAFEVIYSMCSHMLPV
jgi:hypothetical protein